MASIMSPISRRRALALGGAAASVAAFGGSAGAAPPLRVATLKFGTVNWLLDTVKSEGLDAKNGAVIQRTELASTQSLTVALQAGQADVTISDWPWAMRRRIDGEPFRFTPYSSALGAVMVGRNSGINSLADLKGKKLGVAGGPLDKSWLLLRAQAHDELDGDLATMLEPVFGAPPLLQEQLRLGRVDAVLTYWNFAARLDAEGFRRLIDIADVMKRLGLYPPPPLVGFVWRETLLETQPQQIEGFFRAIAEANETLRTSDAAWDRLKPVMQVGTDAEFARLKEYFRAGVPGPWGEAEAAASEKLYHLLADLGGAEFVGPKPHFDPALFWSPKV